jgi:hypothetical protein
MDAYHNNAKKKRKWNNVTNKSQVLNNIVTNHEQKKNKAKISCIYITLMKFELAYTYIKHLGFWNCLSIQSNQS